MRNRKRVLLAVLALALAGCAKTDTAAGTEKRYHMQGEVKALDPSTKSATIDAGKIGDWMEAMAMEYPIKPDAEFQKLHVGDRIEATVLVRETKDGPSSYYVTDIKPQAKP